MKTKIKFQKFCPAAKKIAIISLQLACLIAMIGLFVYSKSASLYQIQIAIFIMQTSIIISGEGLLFGAIINKTIS